MSELAPHVNGSSPEPIRPEQNNDPETAQTPLVAASTIFPVPGTPEWRELNHRRAELIDKENDGLLTDAEREEYEYLQQAFFTAVTKANPLPTLDFEHLEKLRCKLEATPEQQPR